MPICVSVTHGEVISHDSMIDALHDYMDCIDEPGVFMWYEDELEQEFAALHQKTEWSRADYQRRDEIIAIFEHDFVKYRRNLEAEFATLAVKDSWTQEELARSQSIANLLNRHKEKN